MLEKVNYLRQKSERGRRETKPSKFIGGVGSGQKVAAKGFLMLLKKVSKDQNMTGEGNWTSTEGYGKKALAGVFHWVNFPNEFRDEKRVGGVGQGVKRWGHFWTLYSVITAGKLSTGGEGARESTPVCTRSGKNYYQVIDLV